MFRETMRPAWVEINLDHLKINIENIKHRIGNRCTLIGIVKADAYGHGAVECGKVMLQSGASYLAVATLGEALELRNYKIKAPLIMLGIVPDLYADVMITNDIMPIISDINNAVAYSLEAQKQNKTLPIVIKIDTGMGRIGFLPTKEDVESIKYISTLPNLKIEVIMSHFSSADMDDLSYSYDQLEIFQSFLNMLVEIGVDIPVYTMTNSPALYRVPESYMDAVRPGAMLWGVYPANTDNCDQLPLLPVMSVKANIVYIKTVKTGTAISYGRLFTTERDSVIATLPLGYADGLTRLLQGDKIRVLVHGQYAPVLGTICMDQCMIDVTDIPDVKVGDEVVFLGKQGSLEIKAQELMDISGLCSGELFQNFTKRLPRIFIKNGGLEYQSMPVFPYTKASKR